MFCFLLNYLREKYPNKEIEIILEPDPGAIKAYEQMGFTRSDTGMMKLIVYNAVRVCESISDLHSGKFYYYDLSKSPFQKIIERNTFKFILLKTFLELGTVAEIRQFFKDKPGLAEQMNNGSSYKDYSGMIDKLNAAGLYESNFK
jgi:hypothetical protein